MVDDYATESDVLCSFVSFFLEQQDVLLVVLKYTDNWAIFQQEYLLRGYFQTIKVLILLEVALLSLSCGLLPVNEIVGKVLEFDFVKTKFKTQKHTS